MKPATIKATVLLEKNLWVAHFERNDETGYSVARHVFGTEPTDPELYDFITAHFYLLKFTEPQTFFLVIKRKNPKRMKREVRHEMEKAKAQSNNATLAQEALKLELEKNKKTKKVLTRKEKEQKAREQFLLKQIKKKEKKRGH